MRTVNISKQTHRYNYEFLFLLTNIHIFSREIQIIYILSRCAIKRFIDTDYTGEKNLNHLNALNVTSCLTKGTFTKHVLCLIRIEYIAHIKYIVLYLMLCFIYHFS